MSELSAEDLAFVEQAVAYLEHPRWLLRASDMAGMPAERLMRALPNRAQSLVHKAVQTSMQTALRLALTSLSSGPGRSGSSAEIQASTLQHGMAHTVAAAATGFAGGFFGLAGLPVELPVTTAIMLRSIAAIARDFGADLANPEVQLECLEVLALGGKVPSPIDASFEDKNDSVAAAESAYYTTRLGLHLALRSAASYVGGRTAADIAEALARGGAPALVRLATMIGARFGIVVGEKAVAQALPFVGAGAGAAINAAFMEHFNTVARLHFGLRRLERNHGEGVVRVAYSRAMQRQMHAPA